MHLGRCPLCLFKGSVFLRFSAKHALLMTFLGYSLTIWHYFQNLYLHVFSVLQAPGWSWEAKAPRLVYFGLLLVTDR